MLENARKGTQIPQSATEISELEQVLALSKKLERRIGI